MHIDYTDCKTFRSIKRQGPFKRCRSLLRYTILSL